MMASPGGLLIFICRYDSHTARGTDSLFWCYAVMSLLFTHVRWCSAAGAPLRRHYQLMMGPCHSIRDK